ncbi:YolD-like family protein [Neobacillus pocheonensis]|uniref:YolD-like family protein n=1 Tax=Neobacillus pocheonensis TaxID=363869 RepID=A0ABT0WFW8_9BACI|nr:YolD-like family protein [Neobacillus pocheonensis]
MTSNQQKKLPERSLASPLIEKSILGAEIGMTEALKTNLDLIKHYLWDDGFTFNVTGHVHYVDPITHQLRIEVKHGEFERVAFEDVVGVKVVDLTYIQQVLDSGAYIGMDRYGQGPLPFAQRNKTLLELLKQGYANRMFLSQDYCCSIDWFDEDHEFYKENPNWSMTYLLDNIIPQLKEEGVSQEDIDRMMCENVDRWFDGASQK